MIDFHIEINESLKVQVFFFLVDHTRKASEYGNAIGRCHENVIECR